MSLPQASPVAADLAAEITPDLVAVVAANEAELRLAAKAAIPRLVPGFVVAVGWNVLVVLLPKLILLTVDRVLSEVGGMTIEDLIAGLINHLRAKGLPVHPTLAAFADQHGSGR